MYSIITPWYNKSDWSSVFTDYFVSLLGRNNTNVIVGRRGTPIQSKEACDWLYPKLAMGMKLLKAKRENGLGSHHLILDPNYLPIRALRALVGYDAKITTLLNGGAFEPNGIERQVYSRHFKIIERYEEGFFNLVDQIILPSRHAEYLFSAAFPSLVNKTKVIPYPLRNIQSHKYRSERKKGLFFPARQAWEKGFDIVTKLRKRLPIDVANNYVGDKYFEAVAGHKAVLLPVRCEWYGYCAIEAIQCGTIPIVPYDFAYKETMSLPKEFFLSSPVNGGTERDILRVWKMIEGLDETTYSEIIRTAQKHVAKFSRNTDSKFTSAL